MFRSRLILALLIFLMMQSFLQQLCGQDRVITPSVEATGLQELALPLTEDNGRESRLVMGAGLVSSYIWRGLRQGTGPHIQPFLEFSAGPFSAGAWGTIDLNGYEEADLWFAFDLPGGFSLGMQDYYLPELPYFNLSASDGSHAFELNLDWESDNIWLSANCILNEAGGVGSYGRDLYIEAGLALEHLSIFMGAGNGWHTEEGGFNICNLGLETAGEIHITERFVLPVMAQLVFNPDREQLFVVAGIVFSSGQEE
jgi:hypothetical protein